MSVVWSEGPDEQGDPVAGGLGIDSPIDLQDRTDPAASAIAPAAPSTSEEQIP